MKAGSYRHSCSRTSRWASLLALATMGCLTLLPRSAEAQASLAGVARDSSGAVLPGVTVEAASPVLIEKVRTAVTDGSGQYRFTELAPGV
jgi:Carboxypeptidase regulatory-like domain